MNETPPDLTSRVARLEHRQRCHRRLVVAGTLAVIAVALMGQGSPKGPRTLDTERLILRDKAGRVRGTLQVHDVTDFAELILADRKGREIATLWVTADGKTGLILDQRDHAEAEMTEITPGALRVGAVGRHYVAIQTRPGDPYIKVVGERSQAVLGRAELTAVRTGATETRPAASLMFFDKDGKITWSAP